MSDKNIFYTIVIYDRVNDEIHHEYDYPPIYDLEQAIQLAEYEELPISLSRYSVKIAECNIETLEIKYIDPR